MDVKCDRLIFSPDPVDFNQSIVTIGNYERNTNTIVDDLHPISKFPLDDIIQVWFIGPRWMKHEIVADLIFMGYQLKYLDYNSPIFISKRMLEKLAEKQSK